MFYILVTKKAVSKMKQLSIFIQYLLTFYHQQ